MLRTILIATSCEEECNAFENWEAEEYVDIVEVIPLETTYAQGTEITLKVDIPASNSFFGNQIDLFNSTNNPSALIVLDDDIFVGNSLTFIKGSQGKYSNWFLLPYNFQTASYELDVRITLNQPGSYLLRNFGYIEIGPSDCPDYILNILFQDIEGQDFEFSVTN